MAVESSDSKLREKADGDVNRRVKGTLSDKREAMEPELERIRQTLLLHRANRDTVNHPTVEIASNDRQGAIRRRMQKTTGKRDKKLTTAPKNPQMADSGMPDDAASSIAGTDGGGGGAVTN